MKMHLFKIIGSCILLFFSSFILEVEAQANGTPVIASDGSHLSGSWRKPEELIGKVDVIFTGQILTLVEGNFAGTGTLSYGAKIKVLQQLKGTVAPQINVVLYVFYGGGAISEKKPELNHTYIFFATVIKEDNNFTQVLKLIDGTDDHITKVNALIAAAPLSK